MQDFAELSANSSTPSRGLLSYPFTPTPSEGATRLGAIPLYLFLLEATDPTTARTLASDLLGDAITFRQDTLFWSLTFDSPKSPPRAAEFFRSYFSLRDTERKIRIEVETEKLIITAAP